MQMRMLVRRPAGLPPSSRSRPTAPPRTTARPSCSIRSSRNTSAMVWNISDTSVLGEREEAHAAFDFGERALRDLARARRAVAQYRVHLGRIGAQRGGALADGSERRYHLVREHAFAVEAAPQRAAALGGDVHLQI